ncbi:hypothetical protein BBJ29_000530 [Phytophthora kernoviae]|uniref:GAF domain-containing protein n=1 Tax=Phytophthora kernoviae TaxID=325452 RepID=A0A3F2RYC2_9STRA|nr:hypothetical protein BBJ29_000530 [Phytophthora kernoviae]RLN66641.1 hypothetical protein BBP00_00002076 [Phytophthora kernoviae]
MKCPIAAVSFIDKQKQWFKANSGLTQRQIPRDVALCAHTIMHAKRALVVEDTSLDERFQHNPLVTRASAVRFYAGVPITTPNGFCIGSVFVFDVKSHHNVDAKILHKIAAKVLKYMDERLKNMAAASGGDLPAPTPAPKSSSSSSAPPQRKTVSPPSSQGSTEQPAGETALREQQPPPAPVKPEPEPMPAPDTTSAESGAIVQAAQAAAATSTAIEAQGQGQGGLGNMGSMLMNLLARTTETQQQLAAQQGVMFETLGEHSNQLDSLGQSMSNLEKRFEQIDKFFSVDAGRVGSGMSSPNADKDIGSDSNGNGKSKRGGDKSKRGGDDSESSASDGSADESGSSDSSSGSSSSSMEYECDCKALRRVSLMGASDYCLAPNASLSSKCGNENLGENGACPTTGAQPCSSIGHILANDSLCLMDDKDETYKCVASKHDLDIQKNGKKKKKKSSSRRYGSGSSMSSETHQTLTARQVLGLVGCVAVAILAVA